MKTSEEIASTVREANRFTFIWSVTLWLIIAATICLATSNLDWSFGFGGTGLISAIVLLAFAIKEKD